MTDIQTERQTDCSLKLLGFVQLEDKITEMYNSFKVRFEQRSTSDNEAAASKAEKYYLTDMEKLFQPSEDCFESIEEKHEISQEAAVKVFVNEPKMGGARAKFRKKVSYLFYK